MLLYTRLLSLIKRVVTYILAGRRISSGKHIDTSVNGTNIQLFYNVNSPNIQLFCNKHSTSLVWPDWIPPFAGEKLQMEEFGPTMPDYPSTILCWGLSYILSSLSQVPLPCCLPHCWHQLPSSAQNWICRHVCWQDCWAPLGNREKVDCPWDTHTHIYTHTHKESLPNRAIQSTYTLPIPKL